MKEWQYRHPHKYRAYNADFRVSLVIICNGHCLGDRRDAAVII